MNRLFSCLLGISLLASCGSRQPQVDKKIEDGVEVVINHLKPYLLPGVLSTLKLEEVLSIDTEEDEVMKTGMTTMDSFCLDREGNIYFMIGQSSENVIYKYDHSGVFLSSFGRNGQGPGEFDRGGYILVDEDNRIIAKDMTKEKFFVFSQDGVLLEEIKTGKNISPLNYLRNKKYLTYWQDVVPEKPVFRKHYSISNSTLNDNQEFYNFESDDPNRAPHWQPRGSALILGASDKNIYIGDATRGYEIFVFDFSGKLMRKIRKAFRPVAFPEDYKTMLIRVLGRTPLGQERLSKANFPENLPPFQYLFADEQDRLYVMTNERQGERNFWYDIFSSEGAFIGRFQLDNVQGNEARYPLDVVVRGDRLYSLREKDSGFKVLTVYKMIWN